MLIGVVFPGVDQHCGVVRERRTLTPHAEGAVGTAGRDEDVAMVMGVPDQRCVHVEQGDTAEAALNGGHAVSHGQLLRAVWGSETADVQYLRVYVGYLRHKLGDALFESVPGVGYRLVTD